METQTPDFGFMFWSLLPFVWLGLVGLALWDIVRSDFRDTTTKLMWVLIVILVPVLGALLYLVIGRNQKMTEPEDI